MGMSIADRIARRQSFCEALAQCCIQMQRGDPFEAGQWFILARRAQHRLDSRDASNASKLSHAVAMAVAQVMFP